MEEIKDARQRIQDVEKEKNNLIEEAKKINKRLHYKTLELKALQPFIQENPNIRIGPYKKRLRQMEFRISTQAFTPKMEREMVKEVKEVEKKYKEALKVENARRKAKLVEQDIEEVNKRKQEIDEKLIKIREEINNLRNEIKNRKTERPPQKIKSYKNNIAEKYLSLEDIVEIEGKE